MTLPGAAPDHPEIIRRRGPRGPCPSALRCGAGIEAAANDFTPPPDLFDLREHPPVDAGAPPPAGLGAH